MPSISPVYFAAFLIENEIEDQFGIKFDGLVLDFGGTLYLEEEVMRTPFCKYGRDRKDGAAAARRKPPRRKPRKREERPPRERRGQRHGKNHSYHSDLSIRFFRPIHCRSPSRTRSSRNAVPALGYVHRGLEKLADIRDYNQMIQIVERVCGICLDDPCAVYCQGIEEMMKVEVPERASICASSVGTAPHPQPPAVAGLYADAFGFESLFMQFWRIRERIMDINEATPATASTCRSTSSAAPAATDPRAVRLDPLRAQRRREADPRVAEHHAQRLLGQEAHRRRPESLSKEQALELGAAGPIAARQRRRQVMRQLGIAAYKNLGFEPIVETDGDCYARGKVRFRETLQAVELVRRRSPGCRGRDLGQGQGPSERRGGVARRTAARRGLYYIKANGGKNLERLRIRTPPSPTFLRSPFVLPGTSWPTCP